MAAPPSTTRPPRRSLSWRLVGLTLAAMACTGLLLFVPAMMRERRSWLDDRILAAQLAVQALAAFPDRPPLDPGTSHDLLRLAGVVSIRLQEPGRPTVALAPATPIPPPGMVDMRAETIPAALGATLAALTRERAGLILVVAPSPRRPEAVLSIVIDQAHLDTHLRAAATAVALQGLAVALTTGLLTYAALLLLLVRPMRRLTRSIADFRADPAHGVPLDDPNLPPGTTDEIAIAERELAAMQRELRAALWRNARLAALGTTVAKVSHDLRGILSPALLTAERLQASADPSVRRAGDTLTRVVERATALVKGTLDYAGEVPAPPREAVRLADAVQEAARDALSTRPATHLCTDIEPALAVHADRAALVRAFANLLRNAAEAGATSVTLSARADGDVIVANVADNGPGLPEAVRANLFRPFAAGGRPGGTGLGLAITRDLVRAQGGDVALVESSPDGTTFRLALRRPPEAAKA
jgi:signal transduction histidine kinase